MLSQRISSANEFEDEVAFAPEPPRIAPMMRRELSRAPALFPSLARHGFGFVVLLLEAGVVLLLSLGTGGLYHWLAYDGVASDGNALQIGLIAGIVFSLANLLRGEYSISRFYSVQNHERPVVGLWNATFLVLLLIGFATKHTEEFSRAAILALYCVGLPVLLALRAGLVRAVVLGSKFGWIRAQRIFLVGTVDDVKRFATQHPLWDLGLHVVGFAALAPELPGRVAFYRNVEADLAAAVARARLLRPDSVVIALPWAQTGTIDRCIDAFLTIPAEIHLGPETTFYRFRDIRISKFGRHTGLQMVRRPLTLFEAGTKRAFDVACAALALVVFMPLMLIVACLIKLDSPGPVFFLQRRYGFNQNAFRMIKFRTMTTLDDGDTILQATHGDVRITRVGRWLRRFNLDELPQLVNVLRGDMSLVGPRPHALAHNIEFEKRVALYARRHNVKPGITGWAQIRGYRGETDTEHKLLKRVEHDLYYIDNWSLALDLRILVMTVFCTTAYANAV